MGVWQKLNPPIVRQTRKSVVALSAWCRVQRDEGGEGWVCKYLVVAGYICSSLRQVSRAGTETPQPAAWCYLHVLGEKRMVRARRRWLTQSGFLCLLLV